MSKLSYCIYKTIDALRAAAAARFGSACTNDACCAADTVCAGPLTIATEDIFVFGALRAYIKLRAWSLSFEFSATIGEDAKALGGSLIVSVNAGKWLHARARNARPYIGLRVGSWKVGL